MNACFVFSIIAILVIHLCLKEVDANLRRVSVDKYRSDAEVNKNKLYFETHEVKNIDEVLVKRKVKKKRNKRRKKFNWPDISIEERYDKHPKRAHEKDTNVRGFEKADATIDSNESKMSKPVDIVVHIKMNE